MPEFGGGLSSGKGLFEKAAAQLAPLGIADCERTGEERVELLVKDCD